MLLPQFDVDQAQHTACSSRMRPNGSLSADPRPRRARERWAFLWRRPQCVFTLIFGDQSQIAFRFHSGTTIETRNLGSDEEPWLNQGPRCRATPGGFKTEGARKC